jgi:GTP 3',8-cyclase
MAALPVLGQNTHGADAQARGRLARYSLRVSVLEQCQLACGYCNPGSVTPPAARDRWLDASAYLRLARLFRARGVVKVHMTGGEPLVRSDVVDIVAAFKEAMPDADLALTTNALRLAPMVDDLARAGLRRVTVHLDTLRADRYEALMGQGSPATVLAAAARARSALGNVVKMNVVLQRGRNDDELADFLAMSRDTGIEVRFIELMNTGSADEYTRAVFMPGRDVVAALGATPLPRRHASDPAALFTSRDGVVFGVIASDTEPFCGDCDRLRLTADGRLRGCLYQSGGIPLGAALASGASDDTIAALIDTGLDDKRSWHPLVAAHRVPFSMADVGG